ncbi:hypothetical protein DSECCO2_445960 [anaerobic digester metagenome]
MKKPDYFTRAFADLLMKRLLWPEEVKRCAGPGCAFCDFDFWTLITLPFLPFTFTQSMLPVLPIIIPR